MWRLVLEDFISYTEVKQMTMPEVFEANAALEIHLENIKKAKEAAKNGNS